jgi:hypothetical protein
MSVAFVLSCRPEVINGERYHWGYKHPDPAYWSEVSADRRRKLRAESRARDDVDRLRSRWRTITTLYPAEMFDIDRCVVQPRRLRLVGIIEFNVEGRRGPKPNTLDAAEVLQHLLHWVLGRVYGWPDRQWHGHAGAVPDLRVSLRPAPVDSTGDPQ